MIIPELPEKKYLCRIDELPTLAGFVIEAFENDFLDFNNYSPIYDTIYMGAFRAKRMNVIELVNTRVITDNKKLITAYMYDMLKDMRQPLSRLKDYILLAYKHSASNTTNVEDNPRNSNDADSGKLTVLTNDFGISRVKKEIANGDIEGFDGAMKILKKHITDNAVALTNVGYNETQRNELYALWDKVNIYNAEQNVKDDERDNLSEKNIIVCNELWSFISEVCSTGKALYLISQPAKADEYTIASLIKRIRHERPKPRYRMLSIKPNKIRILNNIVLGSVTINKGNTIIILWSGKCTQPADAHTLQPDVPWIIPTDWTTTITMHNTSNDKKGKIKIMAIGKGI